MKIVKGNFGFSVKSTDLEQILVRMSTITAYSSSDSDRQNLFVSDGSNLYLVGLAQDIVAYILISSKVEGAGYASFPIDAVLGLIKRRSGSFKVQVEGSILRIKNEKTTYSSELELLTVSKETLDSIKEIVDLELKGVKLNDQVMINLRRYIKTATLKDAVFGNSLPVFIQSKKGQITVVSYDNYHALICQSSEQEKGSTFQLAVTGSTYGVIEKFVSNHDVTFAVDKYLNLKGPNFFASLPPIQSKQEDYVNALEYYQKLSNPLCQFDISGQKFKTIENMSSLRAASVDASASKYSFSTVTRKPKEGSSYKALQVNYVTAGGKTSEALRILPGEGTWKEISFAISNKILENIVFPFASYETVTVSVYDKLVTLHSEQGSHTLIALGTLDA